jgi:uncharacterized protein YbjT (DUF2867 family)
MNQKLLITGATGLVGGLLAKRLDPAILETVGRRAVAALDPRVVQHVAPIEAWPDLVAQAKADIAICCLGTTLKRAGSQAAFAAVDRDAVISFATASRAAGATQFSDDFIGWGQRHCLQLLSKDQGRDRSSGRRAWL